MEQLPPERAGLTGTKLIHYGPIWDKNLQAARDATEGPVAVLVCHGMGQQVRYETISSVAQAILNEAKAEGGNVSPVEVHLLEANNDFLARAEIRWADAEQREHQVHVYEAYWAPLTEGKVSYWDTIKFLARAARNGLTYSRPFLPGSFQRWMFGEPKKMRIGRFSWIGILLVLLFVAAQVGIIGYVSLVLAHGYKNLLSQPLPTMSVNGFFETWLKWLAPLVPGFGEVWSGPYLECAWWAALGKLVLWLAIIAEAFLARYFIVEFVGDVAAYVSPYKDSKFDQVRHDIRAIGLTVGKVIYGFGTPQVTIPQYRKIVIVGHSLGSVLAYDTFNALINADSVCGKADRREVVKRTRALITFGSPLDKTAFIFRMQAKNHQDWIREQMAASVQPLIVNYKDYRPDTFAWVNIWAPMDIVSGELNYYDDPDLPKDDPLRVINMVDKKAWIPLMAHVQYWNNELLRKQLYRFVSINS